MSDGSKNPRGSAVEALAEVVLKDHALIGGMKVHV